MTVVLSVLVLLLALSRLVLVLIDETRSFARERNCHGDVLSVLLL